MRKSSLEPAKSSRHSRRSSAQNFRPNIDIGHLDEISIKEAKNVFETLESPLPKSRNSSKFNSSTKKEDEEKPYGEAMLNQAMTKTEQRELKL